MPLTVTHKASRHKGASTLSIEACDIVSTKNLVCNWARTVVDASDSLKTTEDIAMMGHVFPLQGRLESVMVWVCHIKLAVDLSCLAGLNAFSVICEIMNEDGTMLRLAELVAFAQKMV